MKPVIKILKISWRDGTGYFLALELMKNGSYKGLQVEQWPGKRMPTKARQKFVPASHIGPLAWQEIAASDLPEKVQARFAEVA